MAERYQRRKLATDAPEGYQRSRSAEREIYGTRAIDGSAPSSPRNAPGMGERLAPADATGFTPDASWNKFFQRPLPLGAVPAAAPVSASSFPEMGMEKGIGLNDPSQAFRVAGAPPIGGPTTSPMPTTPTAMQYYEEGIKGSGGSVPSGFYTNTQYGPIGVSNKPNDPDITSFFKRYRRA